jgi:hypothetical protein
MVKVFLPLKEIPNIDHRIQKDSPLDFVLGQLGLYQVRMFPAILS